MRILLTGCAGFIGFHVCKRLLDDGHEVVGVDNLNDYYSPELKKARLRQLGIDTAILYENNRAEAGNLLFIKANIEDTELWQGELDRMKFDAVCHLAAQAGVRYSISNPSQYISSNIIGFFNVLEYCRHNPVKRLVYASSSSVYGGNMVPYRETDRTDTQVSLYGATKKTDEILAYSYSSLYRMKTVGLRFFTVYGPWGRPDMAPYLFTKAVMENEPMDVYNRGNMERDFTYIDDIVEGVVRVLTEEPEGERSDAEIYNIGNSQPVVLNDFIKEIENITGKKAIRNHLPMQRGDVLATWADTSKLKKDYGYAPDTPLRKGLEEFIKWYGTYGKLAD